MKKWVKSTAIKTVKTMAQAAIAYIGSAAVLSQVNWPVCISTVVLSGMVCILMNVANIEEE